MQFVHLAFGYRLAVAIHSDGQLIGGHPNIESWTVVVAKLEYNIVASTSSLVFDITGQTCDKTSYSSLVTHLS